MLLNLACARYALLEYLRQSILAPLWLAPSKLLHGITMARLLRPIAALIAVFGTVHAREGSKPVVPFPSDAPKRWAAYETYAKSVHGHVRSTVDFTNPLPGKPSRMERTRTFKRNLGCGLFHFAQVFPESDREGVYIFNRTYGFELHRAKNKESWVLTKYASQGGDSRFSEGLITPLIDGYVCAHFQILGRRIQEIITRPYFRLTSITPTVESEREMIVATFESHHPVNTAEFDPIQSGKLVLDPTNYWCIRRCEAQCLWTTGPGVMVTENDYYGDSNGFPVLTKFRRTTTPADRTTVHSSETVEYSLDTSGIAVSDSEFMLTEFGLPEPAGSTLSTSRSAYLWLILAAALCAGLAIVLKRSALMRARPAR